MERFIRAVREVPNNTPLRIKLIVAILALAAVGLLISNVAGTRALRGYLLNRVDGQLSQTAQMTAHDSSFDGDGDNTGGRYQGPALSQAFYVIQTDTTGSGTGLLRLTQDNTKQTAPSLPSLTLPLSRSISNHYITVSPTGAGSDWRILVTPLSDGSGAVTVATTLTDVESTVDRLQNIDVIVSLIVLALLGVAGSVVVHGSLRRLGQIEDTADAIAKGDLSHRAPEWSTNTEMGRLAQSFNTMLGQIEGSFAAQKQSEEQARASEERMRRFVADASHELRTPLTSIRGFAELRRQGVASSPELIDRSFDRIESEAQRMTLLVEDLLLLARLDQQRPLAEEPVDLVSVVDEVVQAAPVVAPDHPVSFKVDENANSLIVNGDKDRLHQVVANILNNAYTHTPSGTAVDVELSQDNTSAIIRITDHGQGMTEEERKRVFERFYRADPARTRAQGGAGLGLSIVAGIVDAHHGSVIVESAPGEGATFTVRIPLSK